jgi:hypothetical protein
LCGEVVLLGGEVGYFYGEVVSNNDFAIRKNRLRDKISRLRLTNMCVLRRSRISLWRSLQINLTLPFKYPTSPRFPPVFWAKSEIPMARSAELSDFVFFLSDFATLFPNYFGEVCFLFGAVCLRDEFARCISDFTTPKDDFAQQMAH